MTPQSLRELALEEVRGNASADGVAILTSDLVGWRDELAAVVAHCDEQFAVRGADLDDIEDEFGTDSEEFIEASAEFDRWKRKALTFKRHVGNRLREVKRMVREANIAEDKRRNIDRQVVACMREMLDAWPDDGTRFHEAFDRARGLLSETVPN